MSKQNKLLIWIAHVWTCFLLALFPCAANASEMSKSNLPAQNIEGFADAFFRDRLQKQIPGAIVVVVEDGHIALKKGYGFADVEKTGEWIRKKHGFLLVPFQNCLRLPLPCNSMTKDLLVLRVM